MKWKTYLMIAVQFLNIAAIYLRSLDPDDQGPDDQTAAALDVVATILKHIIDGTLSRDDLTYLKQVRLPTYRHT